MAGIVGGATLGWSWGVYGAITTSPAGQPWLGGIIGGLAGFTVGFLGTASLTGLASFISRNLIPNEVPCYEQHEDSPPMRMVTDFTCMGPFCNVRVPNDDFGLRSPYHGNSLFIYSPQ